jgi:hypothetical protein
MILKYLQAPLVLLFNLLILIFELIDFFILEPFCKLEELWTNYKLTFYGISFFIVLFLLIDNLI